MMLQAIQAAEHFIHSFSAIQPFIIIIIIIRTLHVFSLQQINSIHPKWMS